MNSSFLLEYLFLKFQHYWTLALCFTVIVFFGKFYASSSNETITKNYLETLLSIAVAAAVLLIISITWHYISMRTTRGTGVIKDSTESIVKVSHAVVSFAFFFAIAIVCGVYLNREKFPKDLSLAFVLLAVFVFIFTLATTIYCFYKTQKRTYLDKAEEVSKSRNAIPLEEFYNKERIN